MSTQRALLITPMLRVKGNKRRSQLFFEIEMSVRTEPRDLSAQLQQTLTIPAEVMAAQNPQMMAAMVQGQTGAPMEGAMVPAPQGPSEQQLHEANSFNTTNEHHPLERTVCINIRASLSDLCLRANAATWSPPSAEATKAIFQQARPGAPHSNRSHPRQAAAGLGCSSRSGLRRARMALARFPLQPHTLQPHTPRAAHCVRPFPLVDGGAQRKFLDLGGSAENQGDLRSVVLHKMTLGAQKSTFPIGASLTAQNTKQRHSR